MTPYEKGWAAYEAGKGKHTNPYADEDNDIEGVTQDMDEWDDGWDDAETAAQTELATRGQA